MKKTDLKRLLAETKAKMLEVANHYQAPPDFIEKRQWEKAEKILEATSATEAQHFSEKAVDSVFISCLCAWGEGKAKGPRTTENLEKQASKAESFAKWQESLGNEAAAKKSRKKAKALHEAALALKKEAAKP